MKTLITDAESYVIQFLNKNLEASFVYHNLTHTLHVVKKAKILIEGIGVSEEDANVLTLAAWFHDTGYTKSIEKHEEHGVAIASAFLKKHNVSQHTIALVSQLIMATKMGYKPNTVLEKIICDADCSHIGSKNFSDLTILLRKEWELNKNTKYTEQEWNEENIKFLTHEHQFYTDYALLKWGEQKSKNLALLLKNKSKLEQDNKKLKQKEKEFNFKKNKIELPERGIETMFRVALRNHITLSDIADTKANILLSVNAIIISMVLSNLASKLDKQENYYLVIPTLIFTLFTVISMVLSILATRPNITEGKFTKKDVVNKKVNLLFFGNFHKMNLEQFEWGISEMMKDRDYLYGSLTKDLYFLGLVLNRKYNLLRTTYTVFMIGIVVSVIAYVLAFYNRDLLV